MNVTFRPVEPEELEKMETTRRGRVSWPILKAFMETGLQIAEAVLPPNAKLANMQMLLKAFVNNHDLPIKVLKRRTKLFLIRLDIDENGENIPNWKEIHFPMESISAPIEEGAPSVDDEI